MIRFIFKYLRPVALFLSIAVLFQCCKIYDKQPVTLEQAINESRLKIKAIDGGKYIFDDIYYNNDSLLYGLMRKNTTETKEIILPRDEIKEQVYDANKHGGADTFITVDGKIYKFESFYIMHDTIYGLHKTRLQNEIFIPIKTIEEIRLYNTKKSKTATFFLVFGLTITGLFIIPFTIIAIDCGNRSAANDCWN